MDPSKLAVKFFLTDPAAVQPHELVQVFHRWIQQKSVPHHVLIDVADYMHVPDGPGIVLVSHEANFSLDSTGGRTGLLYNRKRPEEGHFSQHLKTTFAAALWACQQLEADMPGKASFVTNEFLFSIYDRLLAPNTPETFSAMKGKLETFLQNLYGTTVKLDHNGDPQGLFEVRSHLRDSPIDKDPDFKPRQASLLNPCRLQSSIRLRPLWCIGR